MMAAAALAAGCSQVLGLKDPTLEDAPGSNTPQDAAFDGATVDVPPGGCVPSACPFGCDPVTDTCRDGKLWVFATTGLYIGNDFGGKDVPSSVRATTDALCFASFSESFMARQCNSSRTHAVLYISAADSLALMASKYAIPTDVPVHRADDDVLVANHWNDLLDTTKQPRAPVTTAATESAGIVWTGANETATCKNWTSAASTDSGVRGHTTLTSANWLVRDAGTCDLLARLLCVCWSGGQ